MQRPLSDLRLPTRPGRSAADPLSAPDTLSRRNMAFAPRRPSQLVWLLTVLLLIGQTGCSGCRPQNASNDSKDKKEEEKPKEEIESREIRILPTDDNLAHYGAKPGHWVSLRHDIRANRADFKGELAVVSTNREGQGQSLGFAPYRLTTVRSAVLPKGQMKSFELASFIPARAEMGRQLFMQSELRTEYGGAVRHLKSQVTNRLFPHQMFFVVLARRPDSYSYIKTLESIRPTTTGNLVNTVPDYVTVVPRTEKSIPLPSWSPMWTSIGYVVWDDVDPKVLSRDQQQAMIEWIHWGGQLIVSGPGSLDTLQNSFLGAYLPVRSGPMRPMSQDEAAALDEAWTAESNSNQKPTGFPWTTETAPEVAQWQLQPNGRLMNRTGDLVAERQVGRGRIVVTAFSLTARPWITWSSIDNFFNGCLLRRPGRHFDYSPESGSSTRWRPSEVTRIVGRAESSFPQDLDPFSETSVDDTGQMVMTENSRVPTEALLMTRLRYFSRDASRLTAADRSGSNDEARNGNWDLSGYRTSSRSGVAGWNDDGDCSQLARQALNDAAGISIPDASFVLSCLGVYLFVLVPANWAIFRALGRVEWAWFAVPVLAVIGTLTVVRLARLDIGFARSRTEIAIVEMQPDLPIAHVTRYTGLYSALTTQYDLIFAQDGALALPMSSGGDDPSLAARNASILDVALRRRDRRGENVVLESFAVSSNSTGMIHSEQMLDLNGPLQYTSRSEFSGEISNNSSLDIEDAGILRRDTRGVLQFAWIGKLGSRATVPVRFQELAEKAPAQAWSTFQDARDQANSKPVSLKPLLELASNSSRLARGSTCLIGRFQNSLAGLDVRPSTNQFHTHGLLVAHLAYSPLPDPDSDDNAPTRSPDESEP